MAKCYIFNKFLRLSTIKPSHKFRDKLLKNKKILHIKLHMKDLIEIVK